MQIESWVTVAATVVTAVATLVLAGFAVVQILREIKARTRRQQAVESQISGIAFPLRRQLRSWIGIEPHRDRGVSEWLGEGVENESFKVELDAAESRMQELARLAPEVGGHIAKQVLAA